MSSHDSGFLSFLLTAIREEDGGSNSAVIAPRLEALPLLLLQLICDHLGIQDHATLTALSRSCWSTQYGNHVDVWEALVARTDPSRGVFAPSSVPFSDQLQPARPHPRIDATRRHLQRRRLAHGELRVGGSAPLDGAPPAWSNCEARSMLVCWAELVVVGFSDGAVRVWLTGAAGVNRPAGSLFPPLHGPVSSLAASSDRIFAGSSTSGYVQAWKRGGAGDGGAAAVAGSSSSSSSSSSSTAAARSVAGLRLDEEHAEAVRESAPSLPGNFAVESMRCDAAYDAPPLDAADDESADAGSTASSRLRNRSPWRRQRIRFAARRRVHERLLVASPQGDVVVWDLQSLTVTHFFAGLAASPTVVATAATTNAINNSANTAAIAAAATSSSGAAGGFPAFVAGMLGDTSSGILAVGGQFLAHASPRRAAGGGGAHWSTEVLVWHWPPPPEHSGQAVRQAVGRLIVDDSSEHAPPPPQQSTAAAEATVASAARGAELAAVVTCMAVHCGRWLLLGCAASDAVEACDLSLVGPPPPPPFLLEGGGGAENGAVGDLPSAGFSSPARLPPSSSDGSDVAHLSRLVIVKPRTRAPRFVTALESLDRLIVVAMTDGSVHVGRPVGGEGSSSGDAAWAWRDVAHPSGTRRTPLRFLSIDQCGGRGAGGGGEAPGEDEVAVVALDCENVLTAYEPTEERVSATPRGSESGGSGSGRRTVVALSYDGVAASASEKNLPLPSSSSPHNRVASEPTLPAIGGGVALGEEAAAGGSSAAPAGDDNSDEMHGEALLGDMADAGILEAEDNGDAWSSLDTTQLLEENEEAIRRLLEDCGPIGAADEDEDEDDKDDFDDDLDDEDIDLNDDYEGLDDGDDDDGNYEYDEAGNLGASDDGHGKSTVPNLPLLSGFSSASAAGDLPGVAPTSDVRRAAWEATAAIERALGGAADSPLKADIRTPREILDEANRALGI